MPTITEMAAMRDKLALNIDLLEGQSFPSRQRVVASLTLTLNELRTLHEIVEDQIDYVEHMEKVAAASTEPLPDAIGFTWPGKEEQESMYRRFGEWEGTKR